MATAAEVLPLGPHLASPPDLKVGRFEADPAEKPRLSGRQARFVLLAAGAFALASWQGWSPALALALAMGVGLWAAFPARWLLGPLLATALLGLAFTLGALQDAGTGRVTLSAVQVLAVGALAGLGYEALAGSPLPWAQRLQNAAAGAAFTAIAASATTAGLFDTWLSGVLRDLATSFAVGAIGSNLLPVGALRWTTRDRIPDAHRIRATLAPPYQEPCLRAFALDCGFITQAPDPATRDGLGEVAAWIYRLQWTLMALDREIESQQPDALQQRRLSTLARAEAADDPFIRERLLATAGHLDQLLAHREALRLERERVAALSEYALAWLEEARAGLAVARVQPGDPTPERLGEVLGRLRAHAAEGRALRETARELATVG